MPLATRDRLGRFFRPRTKSAPNAYEEYAKVASSSFLSDINNRAVLEKLAITAKQKMMFVATRRVDTDGLVLDRRVCLPGDTIEVIKWYCFEGPTDIVVKSNSLVGGKRCIPFQWVLEMGAPKDLAAHMPFAESTWDDMLNHPVATGN